MKHLIILGDGMADEPLACLGGKTPLQAAHKPSIDKTAKLGRSGMLSTIPEGFQPGSEVANLSILGYNVEEVFEGRGSLEAANMGIAIEQNELAMRCNLICIENGKIKNHSAGHIGNAEAEELIHFLENELGDEIISFYPGKSYRHLLKMRGGNKELHCTAPHNALEIPFEELLIKGQTEQAQTTARLLNKLILRSQTLLEQHPINLRRAKEGKDKANSIWLWSPGYKSKMPLLSEMFNIKSGAVISATDLINGIAVNAGLEVIKVEGATGLYDSNYEGKAQAAIEALGKHDFVFLHIEASDEAGHEGNAALKTKTIEYLDARIVKTIIEEITTWNEPVTIAILPDHPTPCAIKTHTNTPVPFVIYRPGETPDKVEVYDEFSAQKGGYGRLKGDEFMQAVINPKSH